MSRRRPGPFFALLLAFLLVFAQQAAVAHLISHLGGNTEQVAQSDEAGSHAAAQSLSHVCTTCLAFTALDAAAPLPQLILAVAAAAPLAATSGYIAIALRREPPYLSRARPSSPEPPVIPPPQVAAGSLVSEEIMKNPLFRPAAAVLLSAILASPARADDTEIRALREELQRLKENYEQRISVLEQRLAGTEQRVEQGAAPASRAPSSENAFNPGLSLILGGTYTRSSLSPNDFKIAGFVPSNGEVAPSPRSFALGESELSIAANIDPLFRGQFTASVAPEGGTTDIEEAFIQTLDLPRGVNLEAGRFLSSLGYLNDQHVHAWDFADAPLAYKAFFGGQLKNDGVQLEWLAPTDTFVEVGAEAARGGVFPATDRDKNGSTLGTLYAHVGGDVGESHSWRAGFSYLRTSPRDRQFVDPIDTSTNAFSGRSRMAIADFIWKWAPHGDASQTSFKLQGEYLRRREDGELTTAFGTPAATAGAYDSSQSGWYLQGVYQFMPRWRVGLRIDRLDYGSVDASVALPPILEPFSPRRVSLMTDWSSSEFSRLRLQWARDESRPGRPTTRSGCRT